MNPLDRVRLMEAVFEDGRLVCWQARDSQGNALLKVPPKTAAEMRRTRPGLVFIQDKRAHRLRDEPQPLKFLWDHIHEAAKREDITAVLYKGRVYRDEAARTVLQVLRVLPTPENGLGFERAWSASWVLCPMPTKTHFRIVAVPRHPPKFQPDGVQSIDDLF